MEKLHSDIAAVRVLVELLVQKGTRHAVLSPGSRNAPLLVAIARRGEGLRPHVIVDERSAGFYALGLAQQGEGAVALVCTSGTALLNYGPAVAEAYYQGVPLVVISADRPAEWIDQDDSQTIRQAGALAPFVKGSFEFPTAVVCEDDRWHANRVVNEAVNLALAGRKGPVHINVPLREPLYGFSHAARERERVIECTPVRGVLPEETLSRMREEFTRARKVLVVAGFQGPDEGLRARVEELAWRPGVVVLAESISNLTGPGVYTTTDRILSAIGAGEADRFAPDLLVSFGGAVVSRMVKSFIREHAPRVHWHIDERVTPPDTYKSMTRHVALSPGEFFEQLLAVPLPGGTGSDYSRTWQVKAGEATARHERYVEGAPWSDLKAFSVLIPALPAGSRLQLGNSTPIRYAQLFRYTGVARSDANRGTSGIDGCVSTAVGAAAAFEGVTTLIVGDNSFLYDSNALWIKGISPLLRIVVIQNEGGGIFRFLPGPSVLEEVEEYFETPHGMDIERFASVFRFKVYTADSEEALREVLPHFYSPGDRPAILVVKTPGKMNGEILKGYFKALRGDCLD